MNFNYFDILNILEVKSSQVKSSQVKSSHNLDLYYITNFYIYLVPFLGLIYLFFIKFRSFQWI